MAVIEKRVSEHGTIAYRVMIRKKNHPPIYQSFRSEEAAELFVKYKEDLIDNMNAFEVPLNERITIQQLLEMKLDDFVENSRTKQDHIFIMNRLLEIIDKNKFVHQINFDEWLEIAKVLYATDVYRGGKNEACKRKMAPKTLLKIFNHISSSFSYAHEKGINLENHAIKVIKCYIRPLIKNMK